MSIFDIRISSLDNSDWLQSSYKQLMPKGKPKGYFDECLQLQRQGKIVLLTAQKDNIYLGHVKIVWESDYSYFLENDIPEIQDLSVVPRYRRKGIATGLLGHAEEIVSQRFDRVGIGVGLYGQYGAAQRLYVLRGYVPDGRGLVFGTKYVKPRQIVWVNHNLVLFLTKDLITER